VVPGLDDQMGERIGDWVENDSGQPPAPPVAAVNASADLERFPFAA
jgi:hypothetical protein